MPVEKKDMGQAEIGWTQATELLRAVKGIPAWFIVRFYVLGRLLGA